MCDAAHASHTPSAVSSLPHQKRVSAHTQLGARLRARTRIHQLHIQIHMEQTERKLAAEQLNYSYQLEQVAPPSVIQQVAQGPTGSNPSTETYPGEYGFAVKFHRLSDNIKNKSWDVSFSLHHYLLHFLIILSCS